MLRIRRRITALAAAVVFGGIVLATSVAGTQPTLTLTLAAPRRPPISSALSVEPWTITAAPTRTAEPTYLGWTNLGILLRPTEKRRRRAIPSPPGSH